MPIEFKRKNNSGRIQPYENGQPLDGGKLFNFLATPSKKLEEYAKLQTSGGPQTSARTTNSHLMNWHPQ